MPILGTITAPTSSGVTYPTAGEIVTASQRDLLNLIAIDNPIYVDYANRVHLELLRASRWRFLLSEPKQFATTAGSGSYWLVSTLPVPSGVIDTGLGLSDLDIIQNNTVYNRTDGYSLYPSSGQPANTFFASNNQPTEWVLHGTGQLDLWPPPDKVYTLEFKYYKVRPNITVLADYLVIPSQYKDIIIAGVNYLATMYAAKDNPQLRGDVAYWRGLYDDGKRQMIRDANLFPRIDFMSPDPQSQRSTVSSVSIETSIP